MLDRFDSREFETITYQAETGGLSCPEAVTRLHYYDIAALPTLLFNGGDPLIGAGPEVVDGSVYDPLVRARLDDPSPLRLAISDHGFDGNSGHLTLDIVAETAVADPAAKTVRVAIVEDQCEYGAHTYDNVLRGMLPDRPLTADEPQETQQVQESFPLEFFWNDENLRLVAWVQDDQTREILQTTNSRPVPAHSLRYYALGERTVISAAAHTFGEAVLFNTGAEADEVLVELEAGELPAGWTAGFRIGEDEHTSYQTTLAPGERLGLAVVLAPAGPGGATVTLRFRSLSGEVSDKLLRYTLISPETEILVVDDDGDEDYAHRYALPAVTASGRSAAVWDRAAAALDAASLGHFEAVVWLCGLAYPTLDAADRAALAAYLDAGGRLFVSGQDIGWELDGEGGEALGWYQDYLHADYVSDDTGATTLSGVPGDPIGDGVELVIAGGDGADNQDFPSDIDPHDAAAAVVFRYDAERNGALRAEAGAHRVVYLAFGFEGIDNPEDRALVMDRSLDWLLAEPLAAGDAPPAALTVRGAVPNPFNPRTELRFRLERPSAVLVDIFDLRGRRVRRIVAPRQEAGEQALAWDGRDDRGRTLPAGSYLFRLRAAGGSGGGKLSLVR